MHGLIYLTVERFVTDTYGRERWLDTIRPLELENSVFEPMLNYDPDLIDRLLDRMAEVLRQDTEDILQDVGVYLVSNPRLESVRRLLRFGGSTLCEFLRSLDDLPARAQLAVPGLDLPRIELREHTLSMFSITVSSAPGTPAGFGHVLIGLLRSLADDYGSLVLLEHKGAREGVDVISVELLDASHTVGRGFSLGAVGTAGQPLGGGG